MTEQHHDEHWCPQHPELMREHGELQAQVKALTSLVERLLGRYPKSVTYIIAFLASVGTMFATLYFAQVGLVNEMHGKQQMVITQLADLNKSVDAVQEQTVKNASSLSSLKEELLRLQKP